MTISGFLFGGLSLTFMAGAWYFLKEAIRAKEDLAMARLRGEDGREPTMRFRMAAALVVVLVFFSYGLFPTVEKSPLDTFRETTR